MQKIFIIGIPEEVATNPNGSVNVMHLVTLSSSPYQIILLTNKSWDDTTFTQHIQQICQNKTVCLILVDVTASNNDHQKLMRLFTDQKIIYEQLFVDKRWDIPADVLQSATQTLVRRSRRT